LLYGVIAMLVIAAALEGFWSASAASVTSKYVVGGLLWMFVLFYFGWVGRGRGERRAD
jgi:hypothetical protein